LRPERRGQVFGAGAVAARPERLEQRPDETLAGTLVVEQGCERWSQVGRHVSQWTERVAASAWRRRRPSATWRPLRPVPRGSRQETTSIRTIQTAVAMTVWRMCTVSSAQALFSKSAWYRAAYLGDEPVGLVMLHDETLLDPPEPDPEVGVWRSMVDERFQGRAVGREAMR
jgi:hypothetical protein